MSERESVQACLLLYQSNSRFITVPIMIPQSFLLKVQLGSVQWYSHYLMVLTYPLWCDRHCPVIIRSSWGKIHIVTAQLRFLIWPSRVKIKNLQRWGYLFVELRSREDCLIKMVAKLTKNQNLSLSGSWIAEQSMQLLFHWNFSETKMAKKCSLGKFVLNRINTGFFV